MAESMKEFSWLEVFRRVRQDNQHPHDNRSEHAREAGADESPVVGHAVGIAPKVFAMASRDLVNSLETESV